MVKRLATSPHDPLGITDSACKNQSVVVSVQYGPFNPHIPIRSTTIGKSRVARDPIAMHTSWRSNSDIASVTSIGYPRMSTSGESSTTMHRLLHASGSHPIPTPYDPNYYRSCNNQSLLVDVGDPDPPPGRLSGLPCWHLCLAPTGITRIRLFSVDCGSLRQSGPRPDPRFLRQAELEALTRSAGTNTPRKTRSETIFRQSGGGDGGGGRRSAAAARMM
ncbi:hypothetical protein F511_43210 [Dorcoceras hygrometricum]|uniref:Uncharacterized protein n=1 Tax=Dorcoceras hygrometricum TaxID=472368 RepID=A0A2Z6ZYT5_9LAMI|nr:hypothetical protein F511_43210 [Dorcoceras hygrometricum]